MIEESAKAKLNARELARLERQRKLAETLRLKVDAEERGEDIERQKNWDWTIEDNDQWEKKQARKRRRADYEFHGALCQGFFQKKRKTNFVLWKPTQHFFGFKTMHTPHVGSTRRT